PESIFAGEIHARFYIGSARGCERFAGIQQFIETLGRARTAARTAEFDVTRFLSALGTWSVEADRERIKSAARVCHDDVAGALRKHGADFRGEIETFIDLVSEFRGCLDGLFAIAPGE